MARDQGGKPPEKPLVLSEPQKKDLRMAILLGLGVDMDDIAALVGYSRRNLYFRLEGVNGVLIQDVRAFVARQQELNQTKLEDVVRANALAHLEKFLPRIMRNYQQALDETKDKRLRYQAAKDTFQQLLGKPRQTVVSDQPSPKTIFNVRVKTLQIMHRAINLQAPALSLPLDDDDESFIDVGADL